MNTLYNLKCTDNSLTNIEQIGLVKWDGSEWSSYSKTIVLDSLPDFAGIRFASQGVCGAYVNGEFSGADTGRYHNRVSYAEITSKLKIGENDIKFVLGSHYYQTSAEEIKKRRGNYISYVSAEIEIISGNEKTLIPTDSSWVCESDGNITECETFYNLPKKEYERFWLSAALWKEEKNISVPDAVSRVAKGYKNYVSAPKITHAYPSNTVYTNMKKCGDSLVSQEDVSNVLFEFDNLYCGYVELDCFAESNGTLELRFDYTASPDDVEFETPRYNISARRLTVKHDLKKGENKLLLPRRRASKYVKLIFNTRVQLNSFGYRLDLINHDRIGYFSCSEQIYNDMWKVGKYTLHINKHQEYESCPRNEMKYFSGDGIIDALIDAYTFGDSALTVSSLSYTEFPGNTGLITNEFERNMGLWEYPAWRIVHAYVHYLYFNDTYLVRQHFDELTKNIDWMIGKMNKSFLMYQHPIYGGGTYNATTSVDYTQSCDRLGEKPLLNALFYKSLICMAEFADILGDQRANEWRELAKKVKNAINARLWSEEKQAYLDTLNPSYIPQDGNAICLLFGIAEGERATAVMKTLKEKLWTSRGSTVIDIPDTHQFSGNDTVSPLMNTYESEARFLCGDRDGAVKLLDLCWGGMLRTGAKTFWEYANADGKEKPLYFTICHAWSAGCTYILGAYVLGIRPEKPGYEIIRFQPYDGFDSFEGVVPTPQGLVAVGCESMGDKKKYTLAIPRGAKIESYLPTNSELEIIEY